MTNTIEVPIELIKAGDLDAIRELLPKPEPLFGRWATHLRLGRGIICSAHPDQASLVQFIYGEENHAGGTDCCWVDLDDLTIDPVELTTEEDYENAPEGTVVAETGGNSYQKLYDELWESVNDVLSNEAMAISGPWKILRWGWGE